jgi:hypothetical protein
MEIREMAELVNQEDFLLQKATLFKNGVEAGAFDLSFLKEATFVETIDLSGPRLMMTFDDTHSIIRDEMKVRERDVLEIRIADVWERDGIDQTIQFVIWTMPNSGSMITLNCMQRHIDRMKQPTKEAILFPKKPVETILKRLSPGLKYDIGNFPALEDYHLLPGERPTRLLRQMAKEKGGLCFYRRGSIVFRKLSELAKREAKTVYEHENPLAKNQIIHFMRENAKAVIQDRVERNIIGWDMVKGLVKSGKKQTKPPEFVSVCNLPTMTGLLEMPCPAIDFTVLGNGALVPGMPITLKWNVARIDAPIDESLPSKVVIGTVAHWYSSQKYFTRVKGVLPT